MKLRIRGNTLRLRLSQDEVAAMESAGQASDAITFPNGEKLAYVLIADDGIDGPRASFAGGAITVSVPQSTLTVWLEPAEVSIHGTQPLPEGDQLKILVEKDFACLVPREGEDQENLFPNPGTAPC